MFQVKKNLDGATFLEFKEALEAYRTFNSLNILLSSLDKIFRNKTHLKYLIPGLETYIKIDHKIEFSVYCQNNGLLS